MYFKYKFKEVNWQTNVYSFRDYGKYIAIDFPILALAIDFDGRTGQSLDL